MGANRVWWHQSSTHVLWQRTRSNHAWMRLPRSGSEAASTGQKEQVRSPVIQVARHRCLLHGQHPHGALHALKGRALPHELHGPPRSDVHRRRRAAAALSNLQRHFLRPLQIERWSRRRLVPAWLQGLGFGFVVVLTPGEVMCPSFKSNVSEQKSYRRACANDDASASPRRHTDVRRRVAQPHLVTCGH